MPLIDISLAITDSLPTWANAEPGPSIEWLQSYEKTGAECCVSAVRLGSHLGTHLDAPLHFVQGGASVDQIDPGRLVGPAYVVEIPDFVGLEIPVDMLARESIPPGTRRLLLKTSNTRKRFLASKHFRSDFVALGADSARWILERGIDLVGIDALSIGSAQTGSGGDVHRILLRAGAVVVEGLNLADVSPGEYTLICLPLRIVGVEGAPVRALLAPPGYFA